ncbi:U183 protein, partial [Acromyrmex charruanus]
MHFSQSVSIIQSQVGVIRGVQVLYSDTNPLDVDLVINLPHDGIRLIFDPVVQRLKIIEIYNMKLVKLKYCGLPFNSPEVLPSIEQIEHSFGATHPGVYDSEKQVFVLNFRGLSFYFPIDSKFHPGYAHGLGSLQFPNGTSPLVAKTAIYVGNILASGSGEEHGSKTSPPPLPLVCYHNNLYLEKADIIRDKARTRGLKLHLFTEGSSGTRALLEPKKRCLTKEVLFGDTCEDVLSALGAPSRVFYKAEDKMRIHSPHAHKRDKTRRSDFFYNYFTLGLDILFNAKTQCIKKFVLHTNYPGHYNFNMYHRCEFSLTLPPENNSTESGKLIDVSPSPVTVACLLRVPVEVMKQRRQAQVYDKKSFDFKLLYRGYWSTVLRDMPFSIVQFPLWEYFKKSYRFYIEREIYSVESAICGAIAGGISAAVTTPLDVAKTRIMLSNRTLLSSELKILNILHGVYVENGFHGLFAGFGPRIMWITLGGFIFFGVYEEAKVLTHIIFPMLK